MSYGVDLKYSFIDWKRRGKNRAFKHNPRGAQFQNSQFTLAYHVQEEWCYGEPLKLYGAFLVNHAAKKHHFEEGKSITQKKNLAFYVGFLYGEVCHAGDWSLDVTYEWVQAQAIPDPDNAGIGRGNVLGETFTQQGTGTGSAAYARGNANYKGWRFEGLYAVTDNLSLDALFQFSRAESKRYGGYLNYNKFKLQAIYAF
jgi:hypothetical protein